MKTEGELEKNESLTIKVGKKKAIAKFVLDEYVAFLPKVLNQVEDSIGIISDIYYSVRDNNFKYIVSFSHNIITCSEHELQKVIFEEEKKIGLNK